MFFDGRSAGGKRTVVILRCIFFVVVLIHLSILLALCVMATVDYSPAAMQPPIAFLNSEATLLGIWFAVAPVRQLVRYLGLVAGLVVIWQSFFVFMVTAEPSTPGAASCLATLVLLVAPTLAVSLTATLAWPRPAADIGATVPRRVQFTIRHLLLLTFCVGGFAALLRALKIFDENVAIIALGIIADFTLHALGIGLIGVWAVLGRRRFWPRLALLVLAGIVLGSFKISRPLDSRVFIAVEIPAVVGTLLVFRVLGFRVGAPPAVEA